LKTTHLIDERYDIHKSIKENERLALEILYCCGMMEKLVIHDQYLNSNDKAHTIKSLKTEMHIILKESDYSNYFYIEILFFFIVLYNNYLRIIPTQLGDKFKVNYSMYWDLEKLEAICCTL
jgi:hypothetical protein